MNKQNSDSNNSTLELAPDDNRLPEQSAPSDNGLPEGEGEHRAQEESWEQVNAKLKSNGEGESDQQPSELSQLRQELEKERKAREIAEKRMSDTHREFKTQREELKRIREERERLEAEQENTDKLKDDLASGDVAAPENQKDIEVLSKEYGLTEEEKEFFELNPEGMTAMEKILKARLDSGLSERERLKEQAESEARSQAIENDMAQEMNHKWEEGVKSVHPDAFEIKKSKDFDIWLRSNEALRQTILADKGQYDPSGFVEILDYYKDYRSNVEDMKARRNFGRQSSISPQSLGGQSSSDSSDDESWEKINAKLKKSRSR